jgi:hypothetical protein
LILFFDAIVLLAGLYALKDANLQHISAADVDQMLMWFSVLMAGLVAALIFIAIGFVLHRLEAIARTLVKQ